MTVGLAFDVCDSELEDKRLPSHRMPSGLAIGLFGRNSDFFFFIDCHAE